MYSAGLHPAIVLCTRPIGCSPLCGSGGGGGDGCGRQRKRFILFFKLKQKLHMLGKLKPNPEQNKGFLR